jgi:hypothetical protein
MTQLEEVLPTRLAILVFMMPLKRLNIRDADSILSISTKKRPKSLCFISGVAVVHFRMPA